MRALGPNDLPTEFRLGEVTWRHSRTVKHDFFAATGFYEDDRGRRAVLKMSRTAEEIETMRTLKRAMDPHNILNPGRIISV